MKIAGRVIKGANTILRVFPREEQEPIAFRLRAVPRECVLTLPAEAGAHVVGAEHLPDSVVRGPCRLAVLRFGKLAVAVCESDSDFVGGFRGHVRSFQESYGRRWGIWLRCTDISFPSLYLLLANTFAGASPAQPEIALRRYIQPGF